MTNRLIFTAVLMAFLAAGTVFGTTYTASQTFNAELQLADNLVIFNASTGDPTPTYTFTGAGTLLGAGRDPGTGISSYIRITNTASGPASVVYEDGAGQYVVDSIFVGYNTAIANTLLPPSLLHLKSTAGAVTATRVDISYGTSATSNIPGRLLVEGGTLTTVGATSVAGNIQVGGISTNAGRSSQAYFDQTGGAVNIGRDLMILKNQSAGSFGIVTISGGTLAVTRNIDMQSIATANATGSPPGTDYSASTFRIHGSGPTSISSAGLITKTDVSTLEFLVDAGGITPFNVSGSISNNVDGVATANQLGGDIRLGFMTGYGGPSTQTDFTLIRVASSTAPTFHSELTWTQGWDLRVDGSTGEWSVVASIPEPGTVGLALGGLALVVLRRRIRG